MRVFLERGLNNSRYGVADGVILREYADHSVLNLLNCVGDAVGRANLNGAGLFIYVVSSQSTSKYSLASVRSVTTRACDSVRIS